MLGSGEFVTLLLRCCLLLFAADAVVVDAAAAAAASRSDGRPTDEGVLPEFGGGLDHFVAAKCAAWMYRMQETHMISRPFWGQLPIFQVSRVLLENIASQRAESPEPKIPNLWRAAPEEESARKRHPTLY